MPWRVVVWWLISDVRPCSDLFVSSTGMVGLISSSRKEKIKKGLLVRPKHFQDDMGDERDFVISSDDEDNRNPWGPLAKSWGHIDRARAPIGVFKCKSRLQSLWLCLAHKGSHTFLTDQKKPIFMIENNSFLQRKSGFPETFLSRFVLRKSYDSLPWIIVVSITSCHDFLSNVSNVALFVQLAGFLGAMNVPIWLPLGDVASRQSTVHATPPSNFCPSHSALPTFRWIDVVESIK